MSTQRRHAAWYLTRLEHDEPELWSSRRGELIGWYLTEEDNFRAMLNRLTLARMAEAAQAAILLHKYWIANGAYSEERERISALLRNDDLPDEQRARLLLHLADLEILVGNIDAVEAAAGEALRLAVVGSQDRAMALLLLGIVAVRRGRNDDAFRLGQQVLEEMGCSPT